MNAMNSRDEATGAATPLSALFSNMVDSKSIFLCLLHIQNHPEKQEVNHTTDDNKMNPQLFSNDTGPEPRPPTPATSIYLAVEEEIEKKPGTADAYRPCSNFQAPARLAHTVFHGTNNWLPTRYYWQGCNKRDIYRA
ncbi:MAG: hypothetical protein NTY00_13415 [Deltaproteobacteria bacterium]|nr:hypothetical protein [Deltaproteobacteria bacterium]